MKWVKASERLPIKSHNYHVKIWSERYNYFYHDTNHFEHGRFSPVLNTNDKVYEWLDESEPSYTEQDILKIAGDAWDAAIKWERSDKDGIDENGHDCPDKETYLKTITSK